MPRWPQDDSYDSNRDMVVTLVRDGLVTGAEAARMIGVHRSAVSKWLAQEGVNGARARRRHLEDLWEIAKKQMAP